MKMLKELSKKLKLNLPEKIKEGLIMLINFAF